MTNTEEDLKKFIEERKKKMEEDMVKDSALSSREVDYVRELYRASQKFIDIEKGRDIYQTMKEIWNAEPLFEVDEKMYHRGGYKQSTRKKEFVEAGREVAKKRGIPSYNRAVGLPVGQRMLEPMPVGKWGIIMEQDDSHHMNNAAIQQLNDDIKRTVIMNLDLAHRMLQVRVGKEVTPETLNLYMETLQHTMGAGAVAQEHMNEVNPYLVKDAWAKIITGSDEIMDELDPAFYIHIDELFHPDRAAALKKAIGDSIWVVFRVPTLAVRMADGEEAGRWAAMQNTMAFISAYQLSGEHVVSDLAYAFKHARVIHMGDKMWGARARGRNEIGGMPDGFIADCIQSERDLPMIPYVEYIQQEGSKGARQLMGRLAEGISMAAVLDNTLWLGFYMSGGIGFSNTVATSAISGGANEDILGEFSTLATQYLRGKMIVPNWDILKILINMIITYVIETYEKFPTLAELHWGGAHKTSIVGTVASGVGGMLTGSSTMGLWAGNYAISYAMKEGWLRTGWAGQEIQDHLGLPYLCSYRPEEGNLTEMHGLNYPFHSYSAGHGNQRAAANYGAMMGRGSAWVLSPVVKVAFADPHLAFDFRRPRYAIGKAGIKEFAPDGERTVILPACDILDRGILKDIEKEFPM